MSNYQHKKNPQIEAKFFESYLQMGDESAQKGNPYKAVEYYSLALELKPTDNTTLVKLGNAFCDQNDKEQAIDCYLQALAMDEHDVWATFWLKRLLNYGS